MSEKASPGTGTGGHGSHCLPIDRKEKGELQRSDALLLHGEMR